MRISRLRQHLSHSWWCFLQGLIIHGVQSLMAYSTHIHNYTGFFLLLFSYIHYSQSTYILLKVFSNLPYQNMHLSLFCVQHAKHAACLKRQSHKICQYSSYIRGQIQKKPLSTFFLLSCLLVFVVLLINIQYLPHQAASKV